MALPRNTGPDLREQYGVHLQIGLALSLAVLVVVFRLPTGSPSNESSQFETREAETVDVKQIRQTQQTRTPPPPPRPPVPREVPNSDVVAQESRSFDASLDFKEPLASKSGPPSSDEGQDDEVFVDVETRPDCGGAESLQQKVRYPASARKMGLEGRVFVQFVVDEQGRVASPTVVRGAHKMLNRAALQAVQRLECTPGKQRTKPVKVQMTMPVVFALNQN
ncbi:MAG: energy transducer TonB [Salinibacter sp.]|uniref:energy transducer TonB n=1 Tax=Salinibacter sp. TaxID=2065818 RepID=UPI0035D502DA